MTVKWTNDKRITVRGHIEVHTFLKTFNVLRGYKEKIFNHVSEQLCCGF